MKYTKEPIPFTMVANEVLYRTDISLSAKGIFAYLFSKPEGWEFSAVRMASECKEGRKSVLSALLELKGAGLIERKKFSNGKIHYYVKYSDPQSPPQELRLLLPQSPSGTVPYKHRAPRGSISNKYSTTKKDKENNKELRKSIENLGKSMKVDN